MFVSCWGAVKQSFIHSFITLLFSQNDIMAFCPYVMIGVRRCRRSWSSVTKWGSRKSRERFDPESPNRTGRVYNRTGYDITGYFRLAVIEVQKRSKKPSPTASGGISMERFERGSRIFTGVSCTISPTNLPDMTSLGSNCVKRVRPAKESNNSTIV